MVHLRFKFLLANTKTINDFQKQSLIKRKNISILHNSEYYLNKKNYNKNYDKNYFFIKNFTILDSNIKELILF